MDINKIHDAMKVLKEYCNRYKECKDCVFYGIENTEGSQCYLEAAPHHWDEDKIVENNCTTAHYDDTDKWFTDVIRCDDCGEVFMLSGLTDENYVIGKFCPHCGKKIVNYKKEDKE